MKSQAAKRLIVVLGMHRSGTSTITRALEIFGVDLGNHLLGPKKADNAKGFFEDTDINLFDRSIEAALNLDWHYINPISDQDVQFLCDEGYLDTAVKLLSSKLEGTKLFGFKDPRVAKLLPFWLKVFALLDVKVQYLLSIRNPTSIAKSLTKRDDLDDEKSYLLWLTHLLPCLICTANNERVIVDYDSLLKSPENELRRVADSLNLTINNEALKSFLSDFLDPNLRHDISSKQEVLDDKSCPPLVAEIYASLLEASSNNTQPTDVEIKQWAAEFELMGPCLSLANKLDQTIKKQAETLNQQNSDYSSHQQEIINLNIYLDAKSQHVFHLESAVKAKDNHITHLESAVEAKDNHVTHLESAVEAKDQHLEHLGSELESRNQQVNSLTHEVDQQKQELDIIYRSLTWRITKPFRAIRLRLAKLLNKKS